MQSGFRARANLLELCEGIQHFSSYRVIREGADKGVGILRRKGKEELHPALKWARSHRRLRGPAIAISGCALLKLRRFRTRLRN